MQVESLALALRPRPIAEAADLGIVLVHAHARSVWLTFAPVFGVFLLLVLSTYHIAYWLPTFLIFWCKPWLDCTLLFVLSRAVFGQSTRFSDLWSHRRSVWGGQWFRSLFWKRLSAWRAFTQPISQLEGLRGQALHQRTKLLLTGQRAMAGAVQFAFANVEIVFVLGLTSAVFWFLPESKRSSHFLLWFGGGSLSYWRTMLEASLYGSIVFILEPFYVAAGLTMYLNRRVQLEAWDIEQEFRHAFSAS
jgi:hypothetical protein